MITAEVWSSVVRFTGERGLPGTAFTTQLDPGEWVLITAKHLCTSDSDEIVTLQHPYSRDGGPFQAVLSRQYTHADLGDIAVFKLSDDSIQHLHAPVPLDANGLVYTQTAYIMGFPYSLSFPRGGSAEFPIVKSGIICAERHDEGGHQVFVVDMLANPGFSGGPLVYRNPQTNAWAFAGAVQGTILAPAFEPTADVPNPPKVPSGLSVVASASQINRLRGR